jgi:hypothetical protein
MNTSIFNLATALALVSGTHAASIVDNFESYSPLFSDMNGQGGWVVSNGTPLNPGDGPIAILDGYTWDGSDQSATVGGFTPLNPGLVTLSRAASVALDGGSFSFETAYTESTIGPRNNFSFVLGTGGSSNLLSIFATPGAIGEYDFSWSSDFAGGGSFGSLAANTSTQFQLDTSWNGSAMEYSFTNAGMSVSSGVFGGGINASSELTSFSVNWDSGSSPSAAGNNSITVDNVNMVNTVPEPGSTFLLLSGSMIGLCLLRRTGKVVKQDI